MVVRTTGGDERRVRLLDSTKVEGVVGALGVRRENPLPNELIPGLPIEVSGNQEGDELVADLVTFKPGDLKTARQIQAGLYGTEQRLASVGELAPVGRTKVYFAKNSSTRSAKGKQDLLDLAADQRPGRAAGDRDAGPQQGEPAAVARPLAAGVGAPLPPRLRA